MKKLFIGAIVLSVIFAAVLLGMLYWLVVEEPGEEIRLENIHNILGKESHVFYSDGKTKLGVFFDTAHRQYVAYSDIPQNFVNAMVASEDNRFFEHFGFDLVGIGRAMIKNVQAGRIVQGGSTLTQQTAKNLFKRTDRSLEAKLKELVFALRLEYYYPKEKIFEFYANQFYVSGNGHGLGVAARYYFDKLPNELSLVECAFIAGSVKRPNYYNPFIKKTEQAAQLARSRAKTRLKYVLDKMQDLGMIDVFTYNDALESDIDFKNGKVGFDLDYAMELVRDAVSTTEVHDALEAHDVSNIAVSGVRVITTIDRDLQEKTLSTLRQELSRLDVRLRGYDRQEVQEELAALEYSGDSVLQPGAFLFGQIVSIEGEADNIRIVVEIDKKMGLGVIDALGLSDVLLARVRWQKNQWAEIEKGDQAKLVKQLQVGDRVWVSVRDVPEEDSVLLNLQKYPKVQGGALILKDGTIKGMAGGTENRFFNRAIQAKRTMGSAFKPLVYTAALQLGWNSADNLDNRRNIFVYQDQAYFPRPDHISPYDWVSMSWAGVHSENVATVWLLSHLCDQLSREQFEEVAGKVGLAPQTVDGDKEPYRTYRARIRDRYGIQINREALRTAAYRSAVVNVETDFIFDGMIEEYQQLKELPYGLNYDGFLQEIDDELEQGKEKLSSYEVKELELRKTLLSKHFLLLEPLRKELTSYRSMVESAGVFAKTDTFDLSGLASLYTNGKTGEYSFISQQNDFDNLSPVDLAELRYHLAWLDQEEKQLFWRSVKLGGVLTVAAFDKLADQVDFEYRKLSDELPYSIEVLSQVEDFRITVGLYYLIGLAEQLGIRSQLEPVLSFPLGSNVVTLLEATRMYEGLVTGKVTTYGVSDPEENSEALAILDRIESDDGDILYQPEPLKRQVIDAKVSMAIGNILENVVKFGTGRGAKRDVRLTEEGQASNSRLADLKLTVPLLGKTGTANRYTNASFFGYLPGIAENGVAMQLQDGYAIGVYVGFDNNEPMRRNSTRISGSAGALPTWSQLANILMSEQDYVNRLDPVDLSFYGLGLRREMRGQMNVAVDMDRGGKVREPVQIVSEMAASEPSILTFGKTTETGRLILERNFQPYWGVTSPY